ELLGPDARPLARAIRGGGPPRAVGGCRRSLAVGDRRRAHGAPDRPQDLAAARAMNGASAPRLTGLCAASAVWAALPWLLPRERGVGVGLPVYALLLVVALLALDRAWLWPRLRPSRHAVLVGLGVGVAMTAATYPAFELARRLYPGFGARVAADYALL